MAGKSLGVNRGQYSRQRDQHTQRPETRKSLMSGTERRLVWLKQREQEELWGIAGRGLDGEKGSRVL